MDSIEVFLSSKQSEFVIERDLMVKEIKRYSMLEPINAEDWAPESTPVRELMIEKVNRSMIFVGLFGTVYSEATELEYRAALTNPYRERMIYLKAMPDDQRAPELRRLMNDLNNQNMLAKFTDVRDLLPHFSAHLSDALVRIALKLRKLGEAPPVTKSGGAESAMLRRWRQERDELLRFGFENTSPQALDNLIQRIEQETDAQRASC